jgi:putative ABC transport system permease protein
MRSFFRKLRWLRERPDREAELSEELRFHLEEEAEEFQDRGLSPKEAAWAARRSLGNVGLVKESTRAAWGWPRLEQVVRDAGHGLRQLRRNTAFSVVAIATLALGIGGITAMFSAVDTVLVRPLPYADADRLVMVWDDLDHDGTTKTFPTPAEWIQWRRFNTVFSDIAATQPEDATLSGDSGPEQVPARRTTFNLWNVLGAKPMMGRAFTEDEDVNGAQVLVISHGLWQRRYGGSPDVLGRRILVNDKPYTVIGVMGPEFFFLPGPEIELWLPSSFPAWMRTSLSWHSSQVVARLKPRVALERAKESMTALSRQVTAKDFRGPRGVFVVPLREDMAGKTQTALVVLLCASAALLLIACVNLANLLLSRGAARSREVAVRAALGAGRGRLVAQFLTESLVLAALGVVAGIAVALPAMRFLETLVPETMGTVRLPLDWRVLAFSATVAVAAAIAFGLAPALRGTRLAPVDGLLQGGRGTAGARIRWFQHWLIASETALAVALLTSAGSLLQSFHHLRNTDLGMRPERVLTFELPFFRYGEMERRVAFINTVLENIRAIPGVVNAAASSGIPLQSRDPQATFYLLEGQSRDAIPRQVAQMRVVTRDYFRTIDARLREGRFFEASDARSEAPAVLVNETFTNRHFAGRSAIGGRFQYGRLNDKGHWYTIVGVVKEIREVGVGEAPRPVVYLFHDRADQVSNNPSHIVVRTSAEPASIVPQIREAIRVVDANEPIWRIQTLEAVRNRELSTPTQSTALLGAFALLALVLASVGLYGVLSYAVAQRSKELGIRMALGATSRDILLSVGRPGLTLTVAGLAAGLVVAGITARLMVNLLYGFQTDSVRIGIVVSMSVLIVGSVACVVPARRASRVDPNVVLRAE